VSGLAHRTDRFRALRAKVEASILPLATSVDGRRFSFQAGLNGLALRLGGYAMLEGDGERCLAQVRSLAAAEVDLGEAAFAAERADEVDVRTRMPIRIARGEGVLLDGGVSPFHDRLARPAAPEEMRAWLEGTAPRRARLAVGDLSLVDDAPFSLDAGGFDRHTFLCGQSGSGKSYSLGVVLEQLLLETDLRIVILDPNSDYARLTDVRDRTDRRAAARWEALAGGIGVQSATSEGDARLRLRFAELDPASQGALLQLDPVADREEYAELAALLAQQRPESLAELAAAEGPEAPPPAPSHPQPRRRGLGCLGAPGRRLGARRSTIPTCGAWWWTSAPSPRARSRRSSPRPYCEGCGTAGWSAGRCWRCSTRRTTCARPSRATP
jgi:hypothetical protein